MEPGFGIGNHITRFAATLRLLERCIILLNNLPMFGGRGIGRVEDEGAGFCLRHWDLLYLALYFIPQQRIVTFNTLDPYFFGVIIY
ncbi:MAG: hypothetical protein M2R46_04438 [Verrucomicrobia subdivision 3 bacterium]|nr:hypothetical protein [Limisphaerales bacterium]